MEDASRASVTFLVTYTKELHGNLPETGRKQECKQNLIWKIERECIFVPMIRPSRGGGKVFYKC